MDEEDDSNGKGNKEEDLDIDTLNDDDANEIYMRVSS